MPMRESRARPRWLPSARVMSRITRPLASNGAVLVGLAAACAAVAASLVLVPDSRGLWAAGLAVLMVAIAVFDLRTFIIPDQLTAAAVVVGLAHAAADAPAAMLGAMEAALVRGAAPALVFLAVRILYRRQRGRDGIGLGDVKLAAAGGVWLNWVAIPIAVDIAALTALGAYLVFYLFPNLTPKSPGGQRRSLRTLRLPFGLFLAPAIWVAFIADATLMFDPFHPTAF